MSTILKKTTGLTGINVHKYPCQALLNSYERIIRLLQKLPSNYKYRLYTEKLVQDRIKIINKIKSEKEIEKKIGCGQMEELLLQADKELQLVRNTLEWKLWEPVNNKNITNQWLWPPHL